MHPETNLAKRMREPWLLPKIMRVAEVLTLVAAAIALLSVLNPGPIHLTLFLVVAQGFIILSVVLYLLVTFITFKRHYGVTNVHFAAGETIFRQGTVGDFLYIIIKGQVEVIREDPEHGETLLAKRGPGEYFGEMALISGTPRMATIRTLTPVDAAMIERQTFFKLYAHLPDMRQHIDDVLQERRASMFRAPWHRS